MKNKSTWVFLAFCIMLVVTRLLVPTEIDRSITALQKDMAHIIWGVMACWSFVNKKWWLHALIWAVAFFELYAALAHIGGL